MLNLTVEELYQEFKRTGDRTKLNTSNLRVMTVKALDIAWREFLKEKTMRRAFEKTGLSLAVDGSEDAEKMKFQGQEVGIPAGLIINNPL